MAKRGQPVIETVKASDARQHWSELLNKVFGGQVRVVVEKSGIPVAALISAEDFQHFQLLEAQRHERFHALEETWEAFADLPAADVDQAITRVIAEVRAEYHEGDHSDHAAR